MSDENEPSDKELVTVAGDRLPTTLNEFERSCLVHIGEEQSSAFPDTALIGLLCNAVRLAREHGRVDMRIPAPSDGEPTADEIAAMIGERGLKAPYRAGHARGVADERARREGERGPRPPNPYAAEGDFARHIVWERCAAAYETWLSAGRPAREEPSEATSGFMHLSADISSPNLPAELKPWPASDGGLPWAAIAARGDSDDLFPEQRDMTREDLAALIAVNREEPSEADVERLAQFLFEMSTRRDPRQAGNRTWSDDAGEILAELSAPSQSSPRRPA